MQISTVKVVLSGNKVHRPFLTKMLTACSMENKDSAIMSLVHNLHTTMY